MSDHVSADDAKTESMKQNACGTSKVTSLFCTFCTTSRFDTVSEWQKHEYFEHQVSRHSKCPECFALDCDDSQLGDLKGSGGCNSASGQEQQGNFCKHVSNDGLSRIEQRFWGCGFCHNKEFVPFSTWEDRCHHVAAHIQGGASRDDWSFTKLMICLLGQPQISDLWAKDIHKSDSHQSTSPTYRWDEANPLCQKVLRELEIGKSSKAKQVNLVNMVFILGATEMPEFTDSTTSSLLTRLSEDQQCSASETSSISSELYCSDEDKADNDSVVQHASGKNGQVLSSNSSGMDNMKIPSTLPGKKQKRVARLIDRLRQLTLGRAKHERKKQPETESVSKRNFSLRSASTKPENELKITKTAVHDHQRKSSALSSINLPKEQTLPTSTTFTGPSQSVDENIKEELETPIRPQFIGTGRRKYKRHPKSDENAPKRPPSAYTLFSNDIRKDLLVGEYTFTEIAKIVGERWQILDEELKENYKEIAAKAKTKYNDEMVEYMKKTEYKNYQIYLKNWHAKQAELQPEKDRRIIGEKISNPSIISRHVASSSQESKCKGIDIVRCEPRKAGATSVERRQSLVNNESVVRRRRPEILCPDLNLSPISCQPYILPSEINYCTGGGQSSYYSDSSYIADNQTATSYVNTATELRTVSRQIKSKESEQTKSPTIEPYKGYYFRKDKFSEERRERNSSYRKKGYGGYGGSYGSPNSPKPSQLRRSSIAKAGSSDAQQSNHEFKPDSQRMGVEVKKSDRGSPLGLAQNSSRVKPPDACRDRNGSFTTLSAITGLSGSSNTSLTRNLNPKDKTSRCAYWGDGHERAPSQGFHSGSSSSDQRQSLAVLPSDSSIISESLVSHKRDDFDSRYNLSCPSFDLSPALATFGNGQDLSIDAAEANEVDEVLFRNSIDLPTTALEDNNQSHSLFTSIEQSSLPQSQAADSHDWWKSGKLPEQYGIPQLNQENLEPISFSCYTPQDANFAALSPEFSEWTKNSILCKPSIPAKVSGSLYDNSDFLTSPPSSLKYSLPYVPNDSKCADIKRSRPAENTNSATTLSGVDQYCERSSAKRRKIDSKSHSDETSERKLACPFFKRDPERYKNKRSCPGPGWPTVHRLKGHLYKCHKKPLQCDRCSQCFQTPELRSEHQRSADACAVGPIDAVDGFDTFQETQLKSKGRVPGVQTEEDKWRRVWTILFPKDTEEKIPDPFYVIPTDCDESKGSSAKPALLPDDFEVFLWEKLEGVVEKRIKEAIRDEDESVEDGFKRRMIDITRDCTMEIFRDYRHLKKKEVEPSEMSPKNLLEEEPLAATSTPALSSGSTGEEMASSTKKTPNQSPDRPEVRVIDPRLLLAPRFGNVDMDTYGMGDQWGENHLGIDEGEQLSKWQGKQPLYPRKSL